MKTLYCPNCEARVYFQNSVCLNCSSALAFDIEQHAMVSLPTDQSPSDFKPCINATQHQTCNWALPANSPEDSCPSCQLTEVAPDVSNPKHLAAWGKIEEAKRRLVYNLDRLGIRPQPKTDDNPDGLAFRFLADPPDPKAKRVLTGHSNGIVTLNIAEADDVERERMRSAMNEPYRTLLGHLRHEVGHYYWDQLVASQQLDRFRALFGDESVDYGEALEAHYKNGPPANWQDSFISSYASSHPWEDWAETWAHYLHMMDTLGTAYYSRVKTETGHPNDPQFDYGQLDLQNFDSIIAQWPGVACLVNSFNRSLGNSDAYPFVLPTPMIEKLRFIHELMPAHG